MLWLGPALAFAVLLFMPGLLEQFEAPKIEAVRVFGLGALTLAVIAGRAGRPRRWTFVDAAVAAWLAVEILTTALSVSPRVSLMGEVRQREGLLTSLALAGLYFAARDAFARPGRMREALMLVVGLASVASLYAVAQATGHDPMQWRREAVYAGGYARPFATMGHPNLLGVLTAAAASIALGLALTARRGAKPWLLGAVAALLAGATLLTLSRAAWIGMALGLAIAAGLALRERGLASLSRRAIAAAGAALALVAVSLALGGWGRLLRQRLAELVSGGSSSTRIEIWRTAIAAWRARPLIGQGPDLFEMMFPRFQTPMYWRLEWSAVPFHAHSIVLHTLATRGVLGLLAGLVWAVAVAIAAVRAWRTRERAEAPGVVPAAVGALAAIAVAGGFGALGITGALLVVALSAMLATAAEGIPVAETPAAAPAPPGRGRVARESKPARVPRARPAGAGARRWIGRATAAVVAGVALLSGFTELRASRAASACQAFMTLDPSRASRASSYALTLAPREDRLWRMHAETLLWLTTVTREPGTLFADAEAAARHAVALAPARAENHMILARALGARESAGDTTARAAAEAEFARTFALAPMDGLGLMEYAEHELQMGRRDTAMTVARRVVALYPEEGAAFVVLARVHDALGQDDSARVALQRAVRAGWHDEAGRREAQQMLETLGPGTHP